MDKRGLHSLVVGTIIKAARLVCAHEVFAHFSYSLLPSRFRMEATASMPSNDGPFRGGVPAGVSSR